MNATAGIRGVEHAHLPPIGAAIRVTIEEVQRVAGYVAIEHKVSHRTRFDSDPVSRIGYSRFSQKVTDRVAADMYPGTVATTFGHVNLIQVVSDRPAVGANTIGVTGDYFGTAFGRTPINFSGHIANLGVASLD